MSKLCKNCFNHYDDELDMCPDCGYVEGDPQKQPYALPQGTMLNGDRFMIGKMINIGGFGITYKAYDMKLDKILVIKEYYPAGMVNRAPGSKDVILYAVNKKDDFEHGFERFLSEARIMAKFSDNENIVKVYEYFEENNTAYIVEEYLDGLDLEQFMTVNALTMDTCMDIMNAISDALIEMHKANIIHRDIAPDNIYMCRDGKIKLLDLGAARLSNDEELKTIILKPGYAPPEQYESVNPQGPWTDVYALGATLYHMLTGEKPEESTNRKTKDSMKSPRELNPEIPKNISNTVMNAMAIDIHMRYKNVPEFMSDLNSKRKVIDPEKRRRRRKNRRALGVVAALGIVGAGAGYFLLNLNEQKNEETLPAGTISMWYIDTGNSELDSAKENAYKAVIASFNTSFPDVVIELEHYSKESYELKLKEAEKLPDLFESTGISDDMLEKCVSLKGIVEDSKDSCLFAGDIAGLFKDTKKVPLGFEEAAIYANTVKADTSMDKIISIDDMKKADADVKYTLAVTDDDESIFKTVFGADYDSLKLGSEEDFYNRDVAFLLGTTADFYTIQSELPAKYKLYGISNGVIPAKFGNVFSVSDSDKNGTRAAKKLLEYMLSAGAQDILYIQNKSNQLPINKTALDSVDDVYVDFEGFFETINLVKPEF